MFKEDGSALHVNVIATNANSFTVVVIMMVRSLSMERKLMTSRG